jgi:16S rRNA (adenine1518-N6/adenine1519-N6)-dimethyltransferase
MESLDNQHEGSRGHVFQPQRELRRLLSTVDRRPKKRLGQHFLIHRHLMDKLIASAELQPDDVVLEVGAGTGSLTSQLAARVGRVIAVELDPVLANLAREALAESTNVEMIVGDVLIRKNEISPEVIEALSAATQGNRPIKMVANLPYDVATPLVINCLLSELPFTRLCFTVQREVGDRLLAQVGQPSYGALSVIISVLAERKRIAFLSPQAFWPPPKVSSMMIRLEPRTDPLPDGLTRKDFASFVRRLFGYPRKTLERAARVAGLDSSFPLICERCGVDSRARPITISPIQWVRLAAAVSAQKKGRDQPCRPDAALNCGGPVNLTRVRAGEEEGRE